MTLHLTRLTLNSLSKETMRDLADPYDMHRTLSRVAVLEPDQLTPFLWRQEVAGPADAPVLLVQSEAPLSWDALPDGYASAIEHRSWEPEAVLSVGRAVCFAVTANPTITTTPPGHTGLARGNRKRMGLRSEFDQLAWIDRQCNQRLGINLTSAEVVRAGMIKSWKKRANDGGQPRALSVQVAQFSGTGVITDPDALAAGIRSGIGHARMLGLGLVTVAPLRCSPHTRRDEP